MAKTAVRFVEISQDQIREGPDGYYYVSPETVTAERIAWLRQHIADDIESDRLYQEHADRKGIPWSPGRRPSREAWERELAELEAETGDRAGGAGAAGRAMRPDFPERNPLSGSGAAGGAPTANPRSASPRARAVPQAGQISGPRNGA